MRAFWAVVRNEMVQLYRDGWYLFLLTFGATVSLTIMAYTLSTDIEGVTTQIVDLDGSRESRQFIQTVMNDDFFTVTLVATYAQAEQDLRQGLTKAVIIIPADYSQKLLRRETAPVQVLIDGSEPSVAELTRNHVYALANHHAYQVVIQAAAQQGRPLSASHKFQPRIRYNADLRTIASVMPGLMGVVLSVSAVGAASAFARERERGNFEQLIVTPLGRWPQLLGRMFPYLLIGLLDVSIFAAIGYFAFDVPARGSLGLFVAFSSVYIFAIASTGVFIAQFLHTQHAAMITTFVLFGIVPSYISDIFFPVSSMPAWLQQQSALLPATHFTAIARGIFLKGVGWEVLWPPVMTLLAVGTAMNALAYLRFQKKLG
ncbi:MAG: ABC transporter permease [Anaerolineae bacterium]|nr:ABC transporter permease [Anaerolineae bacterium]